MSGWNLATDRQRWLFLLEGGRVATPSSPRNTDALFLRCINEAQTRIQDALRIVRRKATAINAVANQATYPLPSDVLGADVAAVTHDGKALTHRDLSAEQLVASNAGAPIYWCVDPVSSGQLRLEPAPSAAGTGNIQVLYVAQPRPLYRLYMATTDLATVTQNSATVSSADIQTLIAVGDEFGVRRTTQLDGTTTSDEPPTRWYRISAADAGAKTLTLSDVFAEASSSTALIVTAQVSDLELWRPGKFGTALADFAAGIAMVAQAPELADRLMAGAMGAVARYKEREPSEFPLEDVRKEFPSIWQQY